MLISVFHLGQSISNDVVLISQTNFIFLDCFPVLSVRTVAVTDSFFFRVFSHFSRPFFIFPDNKLLLQFLGFMLINGISGCLPFLGTQLHFKMPVALLKDASGSQA